MKVTVLYFSLLRDIAGCEETTVEIREGDTVGALLDRLVEAHPGLRDWESKILLAVDHEYVDRDAPLADGQDLAIMPPVQGG